MGYKCPKKKKKRSIHGMSYSNCKNNYQNLEKNLEIRWRKKESHLIERGKRYLYLYLYRSI